MEPDCGKVSKGVVLCVSFGLVVAWILIVSVVLVGGLVLLGAVQLVYVLPMIWFYRRRGETETVKGVIIAAGIFLLLNAACDGLIYGVYIYRP